MERNQNPPISPLSLMNHLTLRASLVQQLKTFWMSYRPVVTVINDNTPHKPRNILIHLTPASSPKRLPRNVLGSARGQGVVLSRRRRWRKSRESRCSGWNGPAQALSRGRPLGETGRYVRSSLRVEGI
ncbi:hypothetical protein GWK47_033693 [Chionoecetes opilio]|uniref:Uncharacterized protein n=1 Tax=Chionoecetes opilio TaxID=41210 RepID=A0A8J4YPJ6_CHIOP|nr:hypothetical protein GWK47_033693 [Chionoecetes opilio]